MTRNLHDFTEGVDLNDGGLENLRSRYEHQRMDAENLLKKLQDERLHQVDIVTDTRTMAMVPVNEDIAGQMAPVDQEEREEFATPKVALVPRADEQWYDEVGPIVPNSHAHSQLASHLHIPQPYYKRMMHDAPDLLAQNVNRWLDEAAARRMFRLRKMNGGNMPIGIGRAYLSDRYRRLDLADLAAAFIPMLNDPATGWQINKCALTSLRMHIEAVLPTLNGEVRVGDEVALAVKITSSDVGAGALQVALGIHRVVCSNLAIVPSYTQRQIHLGRAQDDFVELLSDATLKKEDELTIDKMRDVVATMAQRDHFYELLDTVRDAGHLALPNPIAATEMYGVMTGLKQNEMALVNNAMITAGDPTVWGLTNALTQSAQVLDYERKHELETLAGKMLEDRAAWGQLVRAA